VIVDYPKQFLEGATMQNSPDSSGWMLVLAIDWLFAEYIAKNARHLGDAIHKRIAGLDMTTKHLTFRS